MIDWAASYWQGLIQSYRLHALDDGAPMCGYTPGPGGPLGSSSAHDEWCIQFTVPTDAPSPAAPWKRCVHCLVQVRQHH